jgi:hypothetical protein
VVDNDLRCSHASRCNVMDVGWSSVSFCSYSVGLHRATRVFDLSKVPADLQWEYVVCRVWTLW